MANEVLIIKGNQRLSASTLGNLRTSFQKQIDEGLLVLLYGFDAIYIPEGLKCEIVCEEEVKMSSLYDEYLIQHKLNVKKGFDWIRDNIPELLPTGYDLEWQIGMAHDESKDLPDEYKAYDAHFYGPNKSYEVEEAYKKAWLLHLHRNPHHWQYWILINDDPKEGTILLDMPDNYILEMICDWWAFSWKSGNLDEIFKWYEEHGPYMKLSIRTRQKVEDAFSLIKQKLEDMKDE